MVVIDPVDWDSLQKRFLEIKDQLNELAIKAVLLTSNYNNECISRIKEAHEVCIVRGPSVDGSESWIHTTVCHNQIFSTSKFIFRVIQVPNAPVYGVI